MQEDKREVITREIMKSNPTEVLALYSEKFYVYKE